MRKNFSFFLTTMVLFCSTGKVFSQISFSIDTLKISNVVWMCRDDVVIEDFAYGPHFDMLFSLNNNSKDTLLIHSNNLHIYINWEVDNLRKEIISQFQSKDSMIIIKPDSSIRFWGYYDFVLTGEITRELNYRMVSFLPQINRILKHTMVTFETPYFNNVWTRFKNCFINKPFLLTEQTMNQFII